MKTNSSPPLLTSCALTLSACLSQAELIAYWPFDEGEGTIAADVIGGNDATINAGLWTTEAKVGEAAFEGNGGEEVVCDPSVIPTTEDFSMSWWMIDNQGSWGTIMDKSFTDANSGFVMMVRPSDEDSPFRFRIGGWQAYGGWGTECRVPSGAYEDGEWVHITCVYDHESDTASIYVNGELPENGDFNPKTGISTYCDGPNNTEAQLYLRGGFETFNGVLDDIAMWNRPLTAEEAQTVYESGPLAVEVPEVELAITAFDFSEDNEEFTLSWSSLEGATYAVKYSTNLETWEFDLDDSVVGDVGDTTTRTFPVADLVGANEGEPVFFRVEQQ